MFPKRIEERLPLFSAQVAGLLQQRFGLRAHVGNRRSRRFQPQDRQHTPHLGEQRRGLRQLIECLGIAVVLIEGFFGLRQGMSQLTDDCAHRLLVADVAEQLLHPRLDRPGILLLGRPRDALGQLGGARGEFLGVWPNAGKRRVQIQQGRGDFEGQRRLGRSALGHTARSNPFE